MARTFGEYLMTRHHNRLIVNRELIRRVQAAPGVAEVTTLDGLLEITGKLSRAGEFTIKTFWWAYRYALRQPPRPKPSAVL